MEFELLGYTDADRNNLQKTLSKIVSYLKPKEFVLVGGVVIRYHAIKHGISYPQRDSNDLDLIISNIDVVDSKVQDDFLVRHYHVYKTPTHEKFFSDQFYVSLIDKETNIKTELFDYIPYVPNDPVYVSFEGREMLIRNSEDQLCTAVLEGSRILSGMVQEPKKFSDIEILLKIVSLEKAEKYWESSKADKPFTTLMETYEEMLEKRELNPELVQEKIAKPYKQCDQCENINGFKISSVEEINKALGF